MKDRRPQGQSALLGGPLRLTCAIRDAQLARGEKAILHALAGYADWNTWTCYPSVSTIAANAGYSSRQTGILIRRLQGAGVLHLDRASRGGRASDGRGITHHFRIDIDRLESLANPEVVAGFTPKRLRKNSAVSNPEPRSHVGQTNHPSHQLNTPSQRDGERSGESFGAAWMDGEGSTDLRAELRRQGIAGPNLEALVSAGRLTAAQVRAEAASVSTGPRVRNKAAVLFRRLQQLAGISPSPSVPLRRDLAGAVSKLEHLRRSQSRET